MVRIKNISGIYLLLLAFLLLKSLAKSEMLAENIVVAINCGGDSYTDSRGITYEKDKFFSGGQESDFGTNFEMKLTNDAELYQTERWASEDLNYDLPIYAPGKYVLVLKFSEVYFNSPTEKIFDVALGKELVIRNLDIYSKVGKATAYDEFVEFEFKNNKIFLKGKPVEGAYDEDTGTFKISFIKGERDNPKINAIILVKGTLEETDYQQFKANLEELEKQKSEKDRKQREFKKKSKDYEYEDFEDDFIDVESSKDKDSSIFSLSYLIYGGIIGYVIYALFIKNKRHNYIQDLKED